MRIRCNHYALYYNLPISFIGFKRHTVFNRIKLEDKITGWILPTFVKQKIQKYCPHITLTQLVFSRKLLAVFIARNINLLHLSCCCDPDGLCEFACTLACVRVYNRSVFVLMYKERAHRGSEQGKTLRYSPKEQNKWKKNGILKTNWKVIKGKINGMDLKNWILKRKRGW